MSHTEEAGEVSRPVGEIWIADVAKAIASLRVDAADTEQLARVAALLGMQAPVRSSVVRAPLPRSGQGGEAVVKRPPDNAPEQRAGGERPPKSSLSHDEPMPLLRPLERDRPGPRVFGAPVLAASSSPAADHVAPYEPLLPPSSEASTLLVLLSQTVPEGPIDVDRILDQLAENVLVDELPRQPVRTLRFGVQVLVDLAEGMHPFFRDQTELVDRVASIVGRHSWQVRYFTDCPLDRCGEGPGWTWGPYEPPPRGAKVLVLSDFGENMDRGRSVRARLRAQWQETVAVVRRAGCSVVALAPLPPERIPRWLSDMVPVVTWDRSTTTAQAQVRLS